MNYRTRIKKIQKHLSEKKQFPYLVASLINIKYCTGFEGSYGYLIFFEDETVFISDSRYEEYALMILPDIVRFVLQQKDFFTSLKSLLKEKKIKKIFLEEHSITLSQYKMLKNECKGIAFNYGGDVINELRIIKDDDEIETIKKAAQITDACFNHLLKIIKPGVTEWDIAIEIEYFYKKHGCQGTSFDTIVASGAGSSMPHYKTGIKKIKAGEPVLIDMGCIFKGYCSDITRTVFIKNIPDSVNTIYSIVKEAQKRAVDAVKAGLTTNKLDSIARDFIAANGYGDLFGHSLGHGVGLDVHELPAVKQNGAMVLKKGMVITIEPGIYIPKKAGVRIEDMVLVTSSGHEVLTKSTKELIIL
ncbi:MAG: Xaa-Pro peptidase family protein [Spirochaetota bacterium]|nr:Xaa-Pro peptidase family protein [Spirochaetota bacterium]